jgi:hypothetical protein
LDSHVCRIEDGWEVTREKASTRLQLLNNTKAAWEGYASGLENIVIEVEKGDEEIKKIKKRFNLQAAIDDLQKRQKIFNDTKNKIDGIYNSIKTNFDVMTMTLPEDKKDFVKKEIKVIDEKLVVTQQFEEKVKKIEDFVGSLSNFDKTLKEIDGWMKGAEKNLDEIKNNSDKMTPEDRVSYTMDLREEIAEKVETIGSNIKLEQDLLPQGTMSIVL